MFHFRDIKKQLRTLEKLRDILSPKLMNGEIRVKQSLRDKTFVEKTINPNPSSVGAEQKE